MGTLNPTHPPTHPPTHTHSLTHAVDQQSKSNVDVLLDVQPLVATSRFRKTWVHTCTRCSTSHKWCRSTPSCGCRQLPAADVTQFRVRIIATLWRDFRLVHYLYTFVPGNGNHDGDSVMVLIMSILHSADLKYVKLVPNLFVLSYAC